MMDLSNTVGTYLSRKRNRYADMPYKAKTHFNIVDTYLLYQTQLAIIF